MIASVGHYIYSQKENDLFVHLYMGNETSFTIHDKQVLLTQKTNYP
nr:beta-L-arabinofuranosidase domain-containing protein [Bacillus sp. SD088]